MKNFETSKAFISVTTEKEKLAYEAPICQCIEMELESPVLQASINHFEDGGSYGRDDWDW